MASGWQDIGRLHPQPPWPHCLVCHGDRRACQFDLSPDAPICLLTFHCGSSSIEHHGGISLLHSLPQQGHHLPFLLGPQHVPDPRLHHVVGHAL